MTTHLIRNVNYCKRGHWWKLMFLKWLRLDYLLGVLNFLILNIKWLWEQYWDLKIGWKRTRVTGARCPDSEYFSGGLGIHSLGARFSRVGAPDMNSFSASVSLASSSLTWNKGTLFLVRFNQSVLCTCWNKGKRFKFIPKCSLMVACFKIRLQTQIVSILFSLLIWLIPGKWSVF